MGASSAPCLVLLDGRSGGADVVFLLDGRCGGGGGRCGGATSESAWLDTPCDDTPCDDTPCDGTPCDGDGSGGATVAREVAARAPWLYRLRTSCPAHLTKT